MADDRKGKRTRIMSNVRGVDVYMGNGLIDWSGLWAQGYRFAYIKATGLGSNGMLYNDDRFEENWRNAKSAGFLRGAYHFLNFSGGVVNGQDEFFMKSLRYVAPGELPPCGDFESRLQNPSGHIRASFKGFLDGIDSRSVTVGAMKYPACYTSAFYWLEYGSADQAWKNYPLWVAQYQVRQPNVPPPWGGWANQKDGDRPSYHMGWTFWQSADNIAGIKIDVNEFNGPVDDLYKWCGLDNEPVPPAPPPPAHPLPIEDRVVNLEREAVIHGWNIPVPV
jgi:lysozyme